MFIDNPQHHQLIVHVLYGPGRNPDHEEWETALRPSLDYTAAQLTSGAYAGLFDVDPPMFHIMILAVTEFFGRNPEFVADVFGGTETAHTARPLRGFHRRDAVRQPRRRLTMRYRRTARRREA